jgi:hypothetical protein
MMVPSSRTRLLCSPHFDVTGGYLIIAARAVMIQFPMTISSYLTHEYRKQAGIGRAQAARSLNSSRQAARQPYSQPDK